jgi:hypothetical protein
MSLTHFISYYTDTEYNRIPSPKVRISLDLTQKTGCTALEASVILGKRVVPLSNSTMPYDPQLTEITEILSLDSQSLLHANCPFSCLVMGSLKLPAQLQSPWVKTVMTSNSPWGAIQVAELNSSMMKGSICLDMVDRMLAFRRWMLSLTTANFFEHSRGTWEFPIRQPQPKSTTQDVLYAMPWHHYPVHQIQTKGWLHQGSHWEWAPFQKYEDSKWPRLELVSKTFIHSLYFPYIHIQVKCQGCGNCQSSCTNIC